MSLHSNLLSRHKRLNSGQSDSKLAEFRKRLETPSDNIKFQASDSWGKFRNSVREQKRTLNAQRNSSLERILSQSPSRMKTASSPIGTLLKSDLGKELLSGRNNGLGTKETPSKADPFKWLDQATKNQRSLQNVIPLALLREANSVLQRSDEQFPRLYQSELTRFCQLVLKRTR